MIKFRHRYVQDMWWALNSPSLFGFEAEGHAFSFVQEGLGGEKAVSQLDFLQYIDQNPRNLLSFFEGKSIRRLGIYFEQLIACFIHLHPSYELILFNQQIHGGKRSVGELDIVYKNLANGQLIHLELAVKFYLGMGDTKKWSQWFGPNPIDRLDLKMQKLLKKQIHLSDHPATHELWKELGSRPTQKQIMLKGVLFYPDHLQAFPYRIQQTHLRSPWIKESEVEKLHEGELRVLPRLKWLSEVHIEDAIPLKLPLRKPQYLARFDGSGREAGRFFLVPESWIKMVEDKEASFLAT